MFDLIVAPDDPRVADYRGVSEPDLLQSRNLFIAEGRIVVRRLIEEGRCSVRSVLVSEAARQDLESTLTRLPARVPIFVCAATGFRGITGHDMHRGCLALVDRPRPLTLDQALGGVRLAIVLEGVTNADNVGGVFRNAAAFGAGAVLLGPGCCDPLYRKAVRTSMGAALAVPFLHLDAWPEGLREVGTRGFQLVALTPREPAEPLDVFASRSRAPKVALLLGAEGQGLTAMAESAANHRVRIPISRRVDSLNLAVASGIALEHLTRGQV